MLILFLKRGQTFTSIEIFVTTIVHPRPSLGVQRLVSLGYYTLIHLLIIIILLYTYYYYIIHLLLFYYTLITILLSTYCYFIINCSQRRAAVGVRGLRKEGGCVGAGRGRARPEAGDAGTQEGGSEVIIIIQ